MDTHLNIKGKLKSMLRLATTVSKVSDVKEYHLGAVIFDKHKVYCYACNTDKEMPMQRKYNKYKSPDCYTWHKHSAHAEMNCIHKLLQQYYQDLPDYSKLSILVYREHHDGSPAMARPCKACSKALIDLGFRHVYYTTDNGLCYEEFN